MNYYLVAAYVAIWCILFIYLFSLSSRTQKLRKEVEALRKEIEHVE
jgi:CcmD family protein